MKNIETIAFVTSFFVAFAGMSNILPNIVAIILLIFALFYLLIGWTLISKCKDWVTYIITYLIAQSLVTVIFGIKNWPIKNELAFYTIGALIIMFIYLIFNKKSLIANNHPVNKYFIRLIICLSLAMSPVWLHL